MKKAILLIDFDGVLHSYSSGWQGARRIPDPPVPGALEFIVQAVDKFQVMIYSSRSRHFGGKRAIKRWLKKHYQILGNSFWNDKPPENFQHNPFWKWITATAFADPWEDEVRWATTRLLKRIKFPTKKPAAFLSIDDRTICFNGNFPRFDELLTFKPWNKRIKSNPQVE